MPGLPPRPPPSSRGSRGGRGGGRGGRSYSPIHWSQYWSHKLWVDTARGKFCTYRQNSGDGGGALVVLLHGGGYSALSWSLLAREMAALTDCRLLAIDLRGHGETEVEGDEADLSGSTLVEDVKAVVEKVQQDKKWGSCDSNSGVVLVGHSMGGALAARLAVEAGIAGLAGLVVVDVVEGTALDALAGMQAVLRSRPTKFASAEQAIEWCVRTGQVRNHESARVSMPGQIRDQSGLLIASKVPRAEELEGGGKEEDVEGPGGDMGGPRTTEPPSQHLSWRVDLSASEPHWQGWFQGLSQRFLEAPAAKLLLLAGVDRLDKELTVGQMQGKFQMQVLPAVGHTVHEDSPDKVAEVLATFLVRNKLAKASEAFQPAGVVGLGGGGAMPPWANCTPFPVPGQQLAPTAGMGIKPAGLMPPPRPL